MIANRLAACFLALLCAGMLSACGGADSDDPATPPTAPGTVDPPVPTPTPAPTLTLSASPTSINSGASSTLTWSTTNATSCTGSGAWSGSKSTSGNTQVSPTQNSTYTLACSGDGGNVTSSASINVAVVGTPSVTLGASPATIAQSQSSTLTWTSANVDSCTASGSWSGVKSTSGNQAVTPSSTANYTITCSGAGGSANSTASVTVTATTPPPTSGADLFVSPSGNDSNPGSASQPFSTIQKAASVAQAGDVVSIAAGTYTGFTVTRSGTQAKRIEFIADGVVNLRQASNGYGIYINNASYITIDGFSVADTTSKGIAARGATATLPMNGLIIRNNDITDTQEEGMYLSQVANSFIENNTFTDVGKGGEQTTGHGIYLANAGSKNTTIRGNTFTSADNSWGEGLHINGDESVGGDGIISGLVIENNRFLGGFNNAMSLDGVQNSDFRNNIIVATHHHGIRAYQEDGAEGPKNLRIVNNTIDAPAGNAVKTSEDSGASIVFNNILRGRDGATSFGTAATTASNLSTFAASLIDFLPTAAAIGTGVNSLGSISAPATDINGRARTSPPDIGAVQH